MSKNPPNMLSIWLSNGLLIVNGLAILLTWLLIMLGGVVHGTGASLACPDWPTCYGTYFPEMTGLILYEHGHRLLGASVGFLTLVMALAYLIISLLKKSSTFRQLRFLSLVALGLVIFQGVLGGLTVIFKLPPAISISHLGTSMLFLALLLWIFFTAWQAKKSGWEASLNSFHGQKFAPWVFKFSLVTLALVYLQIVSGAVMRHLGAGLACVDLPLCQGSLWPDSENYLIPLHMVHRLGAVLVSLVILVHGFLLWKLVPKGSGIRPWLFLSLLVIPIQLTLGWFSVATALSVAPTALHLGFGALLWVSMIGVVFYERLLLPNLSQSHASSLLSTPFSKANGV